MVDTVKNSVYVREDTHNTPLGYKGHIWGQQQAEFGIKKIWEEKKDKKLGLKERCIQSKATKYPQSVKKILK